MRASPLADISGSTRTFFSRHGIQITDRWFVAGGTRYRIADLDDLHTTRESASPVTLGAAFAAVALLLATLVILLDQPSPGLLKSTGLASLALLVVAATSAVLLPRQHLILATVRGIPVILHATRDRTLHGQLSRALDRAAIFHGHTSPPDSAIAKG